MPTFPEQIKTNDPEAVGIIRREKERRGDRTMGRTLAKIVIEYPRLVREVDFLKRQIDRDEPASSDSPALMPHIDEIALAPN